MNKSAPEMVEAPAAEAPTAPEESNGTKTNEATGAEVRKSKGNVWTNEDIRKLSLHLMRGHAVEPTKLFGSPMTALFHMHNAAHGDMDHWKTEPTE